MSSVGEVIQLKPSDAAKIHSYELMLRLVGKRENWRGKQIRSYEIIGKRRVGVKRK